MPPKTGWAAHVPNAIAAYSAPARSGPQPRLRYASSAQAWWRLWRQPGHQNRSVVAPAAPAWTWESSTCSLRCATGTPCGWSTLWRLFLPRMCPSPSRCSTGSLPCTTRTPAAQPPPDRRSHRQTARTGRCSLSLAPPSSPCRQQLRSNPAQTRSSRTYVKQRARCGRSHGARVKVGQGVEVRHSTRSMCQGRAARQHALKRAGFGVPFRPSAVLQVRRRELQPVATLLVSGVTRADIGGRLRGRLRVVGVGGG